LCEYRNSGLVFFNQIRPWKEQSNQFGGSNLESEKILVDYVKKGLAGDIFFHWMEQDDPYMIGFSEVTGYPFYTILLAADKKKYFYEYDEKYNADISYVGSFLPNKRDFIIKHLFPLFKKYRVKIYGSDWNFKDRLLGYVQKFGQYFNIDLLKNVRQIKLSIDEERKIYSSSIISLNIHEEHQRMFGSDFNERTLKIMASGGFEICDNVKILRKYFSEDELVIAKDTEDWFWKIDYFLNNQDKRIPIIEAGRKKVLKEHTYHNRVNQIVNIYNDFIKKG
jgi:spore maturation protein CgeB